MLNATRYALAAICLTASVGSVALWALTSWAGVYFYAEYGHRHVGSIHVESHAGLAIASTRDPTPNATIRNGWTFYRRPGVIPTVWLRLVQRNHGLFGREPPWYYFPLWYPALIFALAAACALRLGQRFTLRSALVGTSAVAALLGMAVVL